MSNLTGLIELNWEGQRKRGNKMKGQNIHETNAPNKNKEYTGKDAKN